MKSTLSFLFVVCITMFHPYVELFFARRVIISVIRRPMHAIEPPVSQLSALYFVFYHIVNVV